MSNAILINYSAKDIRRVDLDIQVKHGTDMRKLEDILRAVAESSDLILDEPAPCFGVRSLIDGYESIDFMVWCKTEDYWDAFYFMHETSDIAMDEAGIERPMARHEVYLKR
jgi:small conductance mechanosensitive channel